MKSLDIALVLLAIVSLFTFGCMPELSQEAHARISDLFADSEVVPVPEMSHRFLVRKANGAVIFVDASNRRKTICIPLFKPILTETNL